MGWIIKPEEHTCALPLQPEEVNLRFTPKSGDMWECDVCGNKYELKIIQVMHPMTPPTIDWQWQGME